MSMMNLFYYLVSSKCICCQKESDLSDFASSRNKMRYVIEIVANHFLQIIARNNGCRSCVYFANCKKKQSAFFAPILFCVPHSNGKHS